MGSLPLCILKSPDFPVFKSYSAKILKLLYFKEIIQSPEALYPWTVWGPLLIFWNSVPGYCFDVSSVTLSGSGWVPDLSDSPHSLCLWPQEKAGLIPELGWKNSASSSLLCFLHVYEDLYQFSISPFPSSPMSYLHMNVRYRAVFLRISSDHRISG